MTLRRVSFTALRAALTASAVTFWFFAYGGAARADSVLPLPAAKPDLSARPAITSPQAAPTDDLAQGRGPAGPPALGISDHAVFTQAFDAADRGDWSTARALAAQGSDTLAKTLLMWRYVADSTSQATFQEIDAFLRAHPNWPWHDTILANAEIAMPPDMDPYQVVGWYGLRRPQTGHGGIRLGEALIAIGNPMTGASEIRRAWINGTFTPGEEAQILAAHGDLLTDADQRARLDHLLASNDWDGARRQAARLSGTGQTLAQARLQLATRPGSVQQTVDGLPAGLRNDPALLFDEAHALRVDGDDEDAWSALLSVPQSEASQFAESWWNERHIMARDALKAGQTELAYRLASQSGLRKGADFADAEFLSGWIALRFLHDPHKALGHFQALAEAVSYPISVARAHYWLGRTYDVLADGADAAASYRQAAEYPETYYGQLALAHIEPSADLKLVGSTAAPAAIRAAMEADPRVRAIRIFSDLGEKYLARIFALDLARETNDPQQYQMLADLMDSVGDRALALRIAKQASHDNVLMLSFLHPVIPVPAFPGHGNTPDRALVLGVMRQESEFDSDVVSSAGARGLMQLMPSVARSTARAHGLRYSARNLLADPDYNMKLGQAHLADSLAQWGDSYVLAIASYNAGANNVRDWIKTYGDPRDPDADPIDWVEMIPFGETRNYVQRVLESTEVYRSRLHGGDSRLMILADLYRPNPPPGGAALAPASRTPASSPEAPPLPILSPLRIGVPVPAPKPAFPREASR